MLELSYDHFISIFPELECYVEEGVAYEYWHECAIDLIANLGCEDSLKALGLALAHHIWIKSHPNGSIKEQKHVNSRVVYQSNRRTSHDEWGLRDSEYGELLLDSISLAGGSELNTSTYYCWPEY